MKTIFEGTINGEKFNSVQAYNARMIELMNAGKEVNASSRTKTVDENAGCERIVCDMSEEECSHKELKEAVKELVEAMEAEDLPVSIYPCFEDEDVHYLDALVDNNAETNASMREALHNDFDTAWRNITEFLYCDETPIEAKKMYLNDVRDIISTVEDDKRTNIAAHNKINARRRAVVDAFDKAKLDYEKSMADIDSEMIVINDAINIINDVLEFYRSVEAEGLQAIKDPNKNDNTKCNKACNCDKEVSNENSNINTNFKELNPQLQMDLAAAFGKLFEGLVRNVDLTKLK